MDLASVQHRVQVEETRFRSPVSESLAQRLGENMNFLLDHYAIPPSTLSHYAGLEATVPPGWIVCDGRPVSRTTFANLYAVLGNLYGAGDGLTTFNVPDIRGRFIRMVDTTTVGDAGRDPDDTSRLPSGSGGPQDPGSVQADQFASHAHSTTHQNNGGSGTGFNAVFDAGAITYTDPEGGNETRPRNIYALVIIKT